MTASADLPAALMALAQGIVGLRRRPFAGVTGTDGTVTWKMALKAAPTPLGLTVQSTVAGARARVAALSASACTVIVEAQPKAVTAAGLSVLSATAPQPVAGATVTLELLGS